jgi:small subunit ribosomal protein S17
MAEEKKKNTVGKKSKLVETKIVATPEKKIHPRGKIFEGVVKKKFNKRVVIEFERSIYVRKYERYAKSRTKIHARLPEVMEKEINIGDLIRVQECRPLSKIIHFVVVQKLKDASEVKKGTESPKSSSKESITKGGKK